MPGKQQLAEGDDALAAPQTTTALPSRTRRRSTPATSILPNGNSTAQHDQTMAEASNADSDSDSDSSVVSSSSEEPSSDSDQDSEADEITALPLPPDPEARRRIYQRQAPPTSTLSERLKTFLPQLAAANEELERDRAAGKLAEKSLENVREDEGHYIEMNLGLGVLKERDPNKMDSGSESEDEQDDEMDITAGGQDEHKAKEQDVLGKLMGKRQSKAAAGIQEVSEQ